MITILLVLAFIDYGGKKRKILLEISNFPHVLHPKPLVKAIV